MKISETNQKSSTSALFGSVGIFAISVLVAATALYTYSPVTSSSAYTRENVDVNFRVGDVASLILDKSELNLASTPNHFVSGTIGAIASTNSPYGYTLTLEDTDNNTNMTHASASIEDVLASDFFGSKTSDNMSDNTWGFSLDSTNFSKIPVNGDAVSIKRTSTKMTTENETTEVAFGAKVGNIASGSYNDSVLFTMYVNGLDPIPEMQDYACLNMEIGETQTMEDSRDNERYTVTRFNDGRCWMTENLRIMNTTLRSEDTDISADEFQLPESNWVVSGVNDEQISNPFLYEYNGEVYYNFFATTAGTVVGSYISSEPPFDSSESICPKGWKLPSRAEWEAFVSAEEIGQDDVEKARALPYNFTPTGDMGGYVMNSEVPSGYGWAGYWWSSTARNNFFHYMYVDDSFVLTSDHATREYGLSVRCVAREN